MILAIQLLRSVYNTTLSFAAPHSFHQPVILCMLFTWYSGTFEKRSNLSTKEDSLEMQHNLQGGQSLHKRPVLYLEVTVMYRYGQ